MITDVVIVGGGASGMTAAIVAARCGKTVLILEHKDKIGKKILATGNGKCNYTNINQNQEFYRGTYPEFSKSALEQFDVNDTISFFRQLGIYPKYKNGYIYPNSMQASSILDVLLMELKHLKVKIKCSEHVSKIKKQDNLFLVKTNTYEYKGRSVIMSTGGCASSKLGSDGSGYKILETLGHVVIKPVPALVQLKSSDTYFNKLFGVRTEAKISLFINEKKAAEAAGELQFTNYGLSGIPVFEISTYASRALLEGRKTYILIDFIPEKSLTEIRNMLYERLGYKNLYESMTGFLNNKINEVIIKRVCMKNDMKAEEIKETDIIKISEMIKSFRVSLKEPNSFENAQVTSGGVCTLEINEKTMESKLIENLYITGELLDIDGTCGGYNLQWAWSSGYAAGISVGRKELI